MIPKCNWCGLRIYPWTRNTVRTIFGQRHLMCHIERNQKVAQTAHLADELWETQ